MHHGKITVGIARGLKELRSRIDAANIPPSRLDETLNIATWNVREFGKVKRSEAAVHYIAEILGQFDLISIVELRDNLGDLRRVLDILGPYWRAVYSDSLYDAGGNRERIGFVYDKRAVTFTGFAAAANPPRRKVKDEYIPEFTWWRQPYMASFSAGNFDFIVLATHLQWGTVQGRNRELAALAEWIDLKRREKSCEDKDMIVVGDFNIETPGQLKLLTRYGLEMPSALRGKEFGTNLARDRRYDQILHYPAYAQNFTNNGGILDFYTGGTSALFPGLDKTKFTYQLSDHLPLWMQINTNIDGMYLDEIIQAGKDK